MREDYVIKGFAIHTPNCHMSHMFPTPLIAVLTVLNWVLSFRQTSIRDWGETKISSNAFHSGPSQGM